MCVCRMNWGGAGSRGCCWEDRGQREAKGKKAVGRKGVGFDNSENEKLF